MIGKQIQNYIIKSLIGEGGMGIVYLAEHTIINRQVAIKCLNKLSLEDQNLRLRFKNEAKLIAELRHPNIVTLLDYFEDDSGLFIIMEFVKGFPLDQYINKHTGPIPYDLAFPLMRQILDALSFSHAQGIIHRDVKPSNIIITPAGEVRILDFGIAKSNSNISHDITTVKNQLGTICYMSPEQVKAEKLDCRTDIYSLGVTFWQMVTGVNPYSEITSQYEVQAKIVTEVLPLASTIYIGVPKFVDEALSNATSKSKADRFQSCDEFLTALTKNSDIIKTIKGPQKIKNWHICTLLVLLGTCIGFVFSNIYNTTKEHKIKTVSDTPLQKTVNFYNNTNSNINIAYAYNNGMDWKVIQWILLRPNEPIIIQLKPDFKENTFYLLATDIDGRSLLEGEYKLFCSRPIDRIMTEENILDDICEHTKGRQQLAFYPYNVYNKTNTIFFD